MGVGGIKLGPLEISAQKIVRISAEAVNFNIRKCAKNTLGTRKKL